MTPTETQLNRAYQRALLLQRQQLEALLLILAIVLISGLLVADFMLSFRYSDQLIAWTNQGLEWLAYAFEWVRA